MRQLLTETLVMAVLGGACGVLLARASIGLLDWRRPVRLPRQSALRAE